MKQLKIYGDTCTLTDNPSDAAELAALKKLYVDARVQFCTSNIVGQEATKTPDEVKRNTLVDDHKSRTKVANDERLGPAYAYGSGPHWAVTRPIYDVQDDALRAEIIENGIKFFDAGHITQAACNDIDVFLTTDNGIIKRRQWLEQRFPKLKFRRPTELINELGEN